MDSTERVCLLRANLPQIRFYNNCVEGNMMASTTYYLLRSKNSAVGDGAYLGTDGEGGPAMVPTHIDGRRFPTIEAAEEAARDIGEKFGGLEIEVRNTVD